MNSNSEDQTKVEDSLATINPEAASGGSSETPAQSSKPHKKRFIQAYVLLLVVVLLVIGIVAESVRTSHNSTKPTSKISKLAPVEVSITSTGFIPATVTVKEGQAVVWTNKDIADHEVASDPYPNDNELVGFDDKTSLTKNDSYSFIFNKPGTYTYHDNLNPYALKGAVIVKK